MNCAFWNVFSSNIYRLVNAAINRRDECLCKMKELFTSIKRTMRCVIVLQVTAHQRHNYTKGGYVAPCCWWGGCNETGGGGEWSEGGGCWHTLALEHWDMLQGAPLLRHQTQYHPRIMIEMSCSGGRHDETSILTMSPFRKTDNQGLQPTTLNRYSILLCCK